MRASLKNPVSKHPKWELWLQGCILYRKYKFIAHLIHCIWIYIDLQMFNILNLNFLLFWQEKQIKALSSPVSAQLGVRMGMDGGMGWVDEGFCVFLLFFAKQHIVETKNTKAGVLSLASSSPWSLIFLKAWQVRHVQFTWFYLKAMDPWKVFSAVCLHSKCPADGVGGCEAVMHFNLCSSTAFKNFQDTNEVSQRWV